ncbi:hypothetical protein SNEBB_007298 [Seison nebaliae]|nr:hypothetical protein SNEBB_007298 [Seison nebaliae]
MWEEKISEDGGYNNNDTLFSDLGVSPSKTETRRKPTNNGMTNNVMQINCYILKEATHSLENNQLLYRNAQLNNVHIVGRVLTKNELLSRFEMTIVDYSGVTIPVKFWKRDKGNEKFLDEIREIQAGQFGHFYGVARPAPTQNQENLEDHNMSTIDGQMNWILLFRYIPMRTFNELSLHLIEVLHGNIFRDKRNNSGGSVTNSTTDYKKNDNKFSPKKSSGGDNAFFNLIISAIKGAGAKGMNISQLEDSIPEYDAITIKNTVGLLRSEGHIKLNEAMGTYVVL